MTRKQWRLERIRAIERECGVAVAAAEGLEERLRADPSALAEEDLKYGDYQNFRDNLEPTYVIRLFAEFEAGLRQAWELAFHRTTSPNVRDLIDSLAAQCYIPQNWHDRTHEVRSYRNALVHEGGGEAQAIGIREAGSRLCRFFSHLPHHW
jgi:hypothetical protein